MARIPNMNKVQKRNINESIYDVKRIHNFMEAERLGYDLSDEKSKIAFVKYIETIVRGSFEYEQMVTFLREKIDMTTCAYFKKVNSKINGIKIEIHHEPFTLFDIVYIILKMFIDKGYPLDPAVIAEESIYLHFVGIVGLIPLSKTVHELVHAGEIIVPLSYVFGDIESFYKEYCSHMTVEQKEILTKSIKICKELEESTPKVLQKKFIYLDVDGMRLPSRIKSKKE